MRSAHVFRGHKTVAILFVMLATLLPASGSPVVAVQSAPADDGAIDAHAWFPPPCGDGISSADPQFFGAITPLAGNELGQEFTGERVAIPLPPAAWTGLATLATLAVARSYHAWRGSHFL
jgi:hypothetical protein